jgi:small subunit ribosomal protein S12
MVTVNQIVKKHPRPRKIKWVSTVKLQKNPFRQGIVTLVFIGSPKKPNSGKRKLCKVMLTTRKRAIVTIPDGGQHGGPPLQKYNRVLVRGGRCRDVPGVHYKIVRTTRGRMNDTMGGSVKRRQRRSKFGVGKAGRRW